MFLLPTLINHFLKLYWSLQVHIFLTELLENILQAALVCKTSDESVKNK